MNREEHIAYLTTKYHGNDGLVNGFIGLQADPPTNGHRYIIEEARKICDHLFLGVLDSGGWFSADDRESLVTACVKDFSGVTVLRLLKDVHRGVLAHAPLRDQRMPGRTEITANVGRVVTYLGETLAPTLHIRKWIHGNETAGGMRIVHAAIWNGLRDTMEIVGIDRRDGPGYAPATTVRNWINAGNRGEVAALVPKAVLDWLDTRVTWSA